MVEGLGKSLGQGAKAAHWTLVLSAEWGGRGTSLSAHRRHPRLLLSILRVSCQTMFEIKRCGELIRSKPRCLQRRLPGNEFFRSQMLYPVELRAQKFVLAVLPMTTPDKYSREGLTIFASSRRQTPASAFERFIAR